MSGAVEVTLPQGSNERRCRGAPNADMVPPWMQITEQTGEPAAGRIKAMPARSESGIPARMAAAPQVQSVNPAPTSEVSGGERTGRPVKSDKRDSALNAEQQAAPSDNGTLATPIEVAAHPAAAASALQGQILPANFAGSPQSIFADRVLSPDREPDIAADRVTGSAATLSNGGTGTAGIAARSQISPRAATGNPGTATPGGREDGETGGIHSLAPGQAEWPPRRSGLDRRAHPGPRLRQQQLVPAASEHRTESGSPLAETAKMPAAANSGEVRGTNLEAAGNSALDLQFAAADPVAEKPNQAGGGQSVAKVTAQTAHRDNAGDQIQPALHTVLAQQGGAGVEASGMARVPAGAEGTSSAITAHAGASAGAQGGTAAEETFAAMDAGTEVGTPGWIHAGGHTAEAGFEDPALGWVGVRADLSGGNVHAALMPGSAEAAADPERSFGGAEFLLSRTAHAGCVVDDGRREWRRSRNRRGPEHAAGHGPESGAGWGAKSWNRIAIELAGGYGDDSCRGGAGNGERRVRRTCTHGRDARQTYFCDGVKKTGNKGPRE